jgi:ubiquinone/menaquinone biosynthesis C-methylase UbiE
MEDFSRNAIKFDDGAAYEKTMGVWSQLVGSQFLDWIRPEVGKRWIDVGCGNGVFTEQIVTGYSPLEIKGIDRSDAQIEYARGRPLTKAAGFQTGDAMDLPFKDDYFDFAMMALAIFFIPNPALGIAEMTRVVRPGGTIAAYVWDVFGGGLPLEPCHAELREMDIKYTIPPSSNCSQMKALEELWFKAGLQEIKTTKITVERAFDSFEEFWTITAGSFALISTVKNLQQATFDQLKAAVQRRLPAGSDGRIKYTAHANAIKGLV